LNKKIQYNIVLAFLFSLSSLAQNESATNHTEKIKSVIDSLSHQLNKYYVFKNEAIKMSSFIKNKQMQGAYDTIVDDKLLAIALTKDVKSVFRDEHFHVDYNPEMAYEVSGEIEDVPKFVEGKLKQEREKNFGFKKVEILENNIGYIELAYFSRLNDHSKKVAASSFQSLKKSKALIIDLRYGSGGSPEMVNYIISHFFSKKTHVNDIYLRKENTTLKYFTSPDTSFTKFYKMPVYILVSHTTFSAAEALTFELQNFKRATIVGAKTRGGAHVVSFRPLGYGFVADIPFGRAISPITKNNWEGIGITPNEICKVEEALSLAIQKINQSANKTYIKPSPKK
jgi:hypothetical protein